MDLLPHFFRPKADSAGKAREEIEKPAPIAEGPLPQPASIPAPGAATPRWRLEREQPAGAVRFSPQTKTPAGEVTLTLDDVLPRVPTHALKPGLHDPDLPLRFPSGELTDGLARGRPTVRLSRLAAEYPEIFEKPESEAEDAEVMLPMPKILQQMGAARAVVETTALTPAPSAVRRSVSARAGASSHAPAAAGAARPAAASASGCLVAHLRLGSCPRAGSFDRGAPTRVRRSPRSPRKPLNANQRKPTPRSAPPPRPSPAQWPSRPSSARRRSRRTSSYTAAEPSSAVRHCYPASAFTRIEPSTRAPDPAEEHAPKPPLREPPPTPPTVAPPFRIFAGPPTIRPPRINGPAGPAPITQLSSEPPPAVVMPPPAFVQPPPFEIPPAMPVPKPVEPPPAEARPEPQPAPELKAEPEPEPSTITPVPVPEKSAPLEKPPEFFILDQEPLQAIFMTDEELDLPRISELSAGLPGITGCMILAGDHLTQGGERPTGLDAVTLRELSRKLSGTLDEFKDKLPAESAFTLVRRQPRALHFFPHRPLPLRGACPARLSPRRARAPFRRGRQSCPRRLRAWPGTGHCRRLIPSCPPIPP